ncbi:MAG: PKD domain-containing protein [Bacteroidota bacterium]
MGHSQVTLSSAPPATGVTLRFRWTIFNGKCDPVSDEMEVEFKQVPNAVDGGPDQLLCNTLTASLNADDFGGTGTWSVISSPSGSTTSLSSITDEASTFTASAPGVYQVQRSVVVGGCPGGVIDVVTIDLRKLPTPQAGADDTICGPVYSLKAVNPTGRITGRWSQVSGPGSLSFAYDTAATSGVSADIYGAYTLRWLESNSGCPDVADDVQVLFQQQPVAKGGNSNAVCGLIYNLQAIPSAASAAPGYVAKWTVLNGPGTITLNPADGSSPISTATASVFGKYQLIWSESNGICPVSADTISLQFVNPSNPNAGPNKDVCGLVDTLGALPSFGKGEWINDPGNPGTVSFVNKADPLSIVGVSNYGVYRFNWLEANSPCFSNADDVYITFHEQPLADAGFDADTCGLTFRLNATPSVSGPGYLGTWSGPAGSVFSNLNDPLTTVTAPGFGKHKFTWTEINGSTCGASLDEVEITFIQIPVADAGLVPAGGCGKSVDLKAIPSVGVGQWSAAGPADFNFSNPTNPVTNGVADDFGTYTLFWKETNFGNNGGSCSSTDSASIIFAPQPAAYAGADSAVCGNTITLNAVQSVPSSVVSWKVIGNPADVTFSPANSKTTTVTTTRFGELSFVFSEVVAGGACSSSDTVKVNFVQQPVADAGIPDSVCALSTKLTAVPTAGNGSWKSLSPGAVFSPDLSAVSPTVAVSSYGIYRFVWKEDNGAPCAVSTDTVIVGFFRTPTPKAGIDFSICGTEAELNATATAAPGTWKTTNPNVSFANVSDPKTKALLAAATSVDYGLVNIQWEETNAICKAADQVAVYFSEMPNAEAGPNQLLCGTDFTLNAVPSVGIGKWEYPGDDGDLEEFNNQNTPNAYGTVANFGDFMFNWIENNPGVCPSDTDQTKLSFTQQPNAYAGPDSSVCSMTHRLTGARSVGNGNWTRVSGPGTASFSSISDDTTNVTVSAPGNYRFAWTEFNSASCPISSDTVAVYFERTPVANAGPDLTICGLATNLQAVPSLGTGQWTFIGDPAATVSYGSANNPTSVFTSNKYGPHAMIWMETNTAVCGPKTDTVVVTFVEAPVANAGGPQYDICGSTLTLKATPSAGTGQWSQVSGPGAGTFSSTFDPASNFAAVASGFGAYVLRWTEDNGSTCPPSSQDIRVNFFQQPVANAGLPAEVCGLNGNLAAVASAGTGNWQFIAAPGQSVLFGNNTQAQTTVTANKYGDFQFVWSERNGNVCPPDQALVIISFKEMPTANAGTDQVVCGFSTALNSINSTGSGTWQLPAGSPLSFADASVSTTTVSTTAYGEYDIIWSETNGKVCPASLDTVKVEFAEQPVANAGSDDNICGQTYTLAALPSVGMGTWTTTAPGAVFSPSENFPNATVTTTGFGTYSFTWTEENKAPCNTSSDVVSINFIKAPAATISVSPDTTCAGDAVNLTLNLTGTGPFNIIYTANNGTPVVRTGMNNGDVITVSPTQTTTYTVTQVTDGSPEGCVTINSTPVTVTVNPLPTVNVNGRYTICDQDSLTIPVAFTGTAPFTTTFTNGETRTFSGSGPYFYTYKPGTATTIGTTAISDKFCTGTAGSGTASVIINQLPQGTITRLGGSFCANDSVKFRFDFSTGKAPWTVYLTSGGTQRVLPMDSTAYLLTDVPPTGTTTYRIDSITDANGCLGSGNSTTVLVHQNPSYALTVDTLICQNTSTDVEFAFTPATSSAWAVDYRFNGSQNTTPDLGNGGKLILTPSGTTSYTFTRVTDKTTGCSTDMDSTVLITVVPNAQLTSTIDRNEMCREENALITFNYVGVEPFEVTLNDGQTFTGLRNGSTIQVSPTGDFTYQITGFKDGSGITCPANYSMSHRIVINQLPPVLFSVSGTSSCKPLLPVFVNLTDPNYIGPNGCSWDFGDGSTSNDVNPVHEFTETGVYNIRLIVTSAKGCTDTLTQATRINLNPDPVAGFHWTPERPDVIQNDVQIVNTSTGAVAYNWDFAGLGQSTNLNPAFRFPNDDSATYRICLTATSDSGCVNQLCDFLVITGEMSVYVPNAFTPDGDGLNEFFLPSVLGSEVDTYEFLIFNRWGEVIFKSTDPKHGWDGKVAGTDAKADVYPWKLTFKDKYTVNRHEYFGTVNLLR